MDFKCKKKEENSENYWKRQFSFDFHFVLNIQYFYGADAFTKLKQLKSK